MRKALFRVALVFLIALIIMMVAAQAVAAELPAQNASDYAQLKKILTDPKGGHAKLTKDIYINAAEVGPNIDIAITLGADAVYILDLNNYTLSFHFNHFGNEFDDHGVVITTGNSALFTVKGPGTIFGGETAIEKEGQGELIIDGAYLEGMMAFGIWHKGGITHLKGSTTITGNFGDVAQDECLIIKDTLVKALIVDHQTPFTPKRAILENGILTGDLELDRNVLVADNLTIAKGSSLTVKHQGGLVVKNKFVNNGNYTYKEGLESIGGKAFMKAGSQTILRKSITVDTLKTENHAILTIENGAVLTINKTLEHYGGIINKDGEVVLKGTYSGSGWLEGVPGLAEQPDNGNNDSPGDHNPAEEENSNPASWALEHVEASAQTWLKESHLLSYFQRNILREEFAEIVVRLYEALSGTPIPYPEESPFKDCNFVHVIQAYNAGLVSGRGEGIFDPHGLITRQETAKMFDNLLQALKLSPITTTEYISFKDEAQIASYAKGPIQLMYKLGLIQGEGNGVMSPLKYSSRETAIVIANRFYDKFK